MITQHLLFIYLGLSVGGNPRKESFWQPVLNKLRKRLAAWHHKYLSFGGRVCLLKSTLLSIPRLTQSIMSMNFKDNASLMVGSPKKRGSSANCKSETLREPLHTHTRPPTIGMSYNLVIIFVIVKYFETVPWT